MAVAENKSESFHTIWMLYGIPGAVVASISMISNVVFYTIGPGAIWNIGFVESVLGVIIGMFGAFLRMLTWPYGLYVLFTDPGGFFPWLFYLWYQ